MSNKVKIELNSRGIREILKSSGMKECVKKCADDIKSRCGSGYETDVKYMGTRVIASAYTATSDAMRDNLENNTLLKASRV